MLETSPAPPTPALKPAYVQAIARSAPSETERSVAAIERIQAVPTLLKVICETTGLGLAGIICVAGDTWATCALRDNINFGLTRASAVGITATLGRHVRSSGTPLIIDSASRGQHHRYNPTLTLHHIESYICVPIFLTNGHYFGNLFALHTQPIKVSEPRVVSMFEDFAKLIAYQLAEQQHQEQDRAALLDERDVNELREQFIAILGHDLRNPLQAMQAMCGLMSVRHPDEWSVALTTRMSTTVKRMALLIDDVLDFARARLGSGIGVQIQTAANIDKGLDDIVRELQDARPERSIVADIDVHRSVRCDVGRIQQLVSNLIGNALMHGAPTSPVRFSAAATNAELVIRVWNDGDPIPPESIGKIFSPFWRRATSANRNGLGLGLHICAQIVTAHLGELSVTSSAEAGTEFVARIPRGDPQEA
jgi:signal transduction histidine kinase